MNKNVIFLISMLLFFFAAVSKAEPNGFAFPAKSFLNLQRTLPYQDNDRGLQRSNKVVHKALEVNKTRFGGDISFLNAVFQKPVMMNQNIFLKSMHFVSVDFQDEVSINWSQFTQPIDLYNVNFDKGLTLYHSVFEDTIKFNHSSFKRPVMFQGARFFKSFLFSDLTFYAPVNFYKAAFYHQAAFKNSTFHQGVDFSYADFKHGLLFDEVNFNQWTSFSNASFEGMVQFKRSVFSGLLDFSYVTDIKESIDLTKIDRNLSGEKIRINLLGSDIEKFDLYYTDFELYFPEDTAHAKKLIVYKMLLANFKNRGYVSSYELLYPQYRAYMYRHDGEAMTNMIQKYWWNYGLNKEWVFHWIAYFIIFFTLINAFFFESLISKYCDLPFLEEAHSDVIVISNPLTRYIYYLPRAFLLTFIMFFGGTVRMGLGIGVLKTNSLVANFYLLIIMITGFVCVFFSLKYLIG